MPEPEPEREPGDLAPEWGNLSNNVYGILHGHGDAAPIAVCFERHGWSSRSSSWYGYEVGTTWCEVELEPADGPDILLNGVMDPSRFTDLAALLDRFGLSVVHAGAVRRGGRPAQGDAWVTPCMIVIPSD